MDEVDTMDKLQEPMDRHWVELDRPEDSLVQEALEHTEWHKLRINEKSNEQSDLSNQILSVRCRDSGWKHLDGWSRLLSTSSPTTSKPRLLQHHVTGITVTWMLQTFRTTEFPSVVSRDTTLYPV